MNKLLLIDVLITEKMFLFLFVTHEIAANSTRLTIIKYLSDVVSIIPGVEIQGKESWRGMKWSRNNKNEIRTNPYQVLSVCRARYKCFT